MFIACQAYKVLEQPTNNKHRVGITILYNFVYNRKSVYVEQIFT